MRRRTLHGGFHCVQARCAYRLRQGLSRPYIIPYRRHRPSNAAASGKSPQETRPMRIGIAGIGKMGAAIAQRLMDVGHTITAWNRSADKVKPIAAAGAAVAATPAELASNNDAVITILTDAAAIDAVYSGASGL